MKKVLKLKPSKDPFFDELESLSIKFQETPAEETKFSSAIDQFEKQLDSMSVPQVLAQRNYSSFNESYFFGE